MDNATIASWGLVASFLPWRDARALASTCRQLRPLFALAQKDLLVLHKFKHHFLRRILTRVATNGLLASKLLVDKGHRQLLTRPKALGRWQFILPGTYLPPGLYYGIALIVQGNLGGQCKLEYIGKEIFRYEMRKLDMNEQKIVPLPYFWHNLPPYFRAKQARLCSIALDVREILVHYQPCDITAFYCNQPVFSRGFNLIDYVNGHVNLLRFGSSIRNGTGPQHYSTMVKLAARQE